MRTNIRKTIARSCGLRHWHFMNKRKQRMNVLKKRTTQHTPTLEKEKLQTSITPMCADLFVDTLSAREIVSNETSESKHTDLILQVLNKKRELTIEYIAKRQLVNAKNKVLSLLKKRFFIYKRNFRLDKSIPWVKELPLRPNNRDTLYFHASVLRLNKSNLFEVYYDSFKTLFSGQEILDGHTFCFKVSRRLNELAYTLNAIDNGKFNSLNFLFNIYKRQDYDFSSMIQEIISDEPLPTPDAAVLHDNFLSVFSRINYFDYNDFTGELKPVVENSLFVFRSELYPFLVTEYILLRFLLRYTPDYIRNTILETLEAKYCQNSVTPNICQLYPGTFTLLYILYFSNNNCVDTYGVLELLKNARSSAESGDYSIVTTQLRKISNVICEILYKIEQEQIIIPDTMKNTFLSYCSFYKYSYLLDEKVKSSLNSLPFLVRE